MTPTDYDSLSIAEATTWPITLDEARQQLRILVEGSPDLGDDDAWITDIGIPGATAAAEQYMRRYTTNRTIVCTYSSFANPIVLPYPVYSITHIKYYDSDSVLQTVSPSDYELVTTDQGSFIRTAYQATLPTPRSHPGSVVVTMECGFGPTASYVPKRIKSGILVYLTYLFENRGDADVAIPRSGEFVLKNSWVV